MKKEIREIRKNELKELIPAIETFQEFMKKYGKEFDKQDRFMYGQDFLVLANKDANKIIDTPAEIDKFFKTATQVVGMVYYTR
jgi:hypothetical protein